MAKRTTGGGRHGGVLNIRATDEVKDYFGKAIDMHGVKQNAAISRLIELFAPAPYLVQQAMLGTAAQEFNEAASKAALDYLLKMAHRKPKFTNDDEDAPKRGRPRKNAPRNPVKESD